MRDHDDELERHGEGRRGLLKCMAWGGAGIMWSVAAGVPGATFLGGQAQAQTKGAMGGDLTFVQISDTHIGFKRAPNMDPGATLKETIARIKAMPVQPSFILHTGDITHLATPEQFDTATQLLGELNLPIHYVPGEHDIKDGTDPRPFLDHFGKMAKGDGWYSFDANGVHFIGLVNVVHLGDHGMGTFGDAQAAWLKDDVAHLPASTPIVVFSHFPMWSLYPNWGWGTQDAAAAFQPLQRFGSVTVLSGHIHQIQQSVEGKMSFHTARSTAYPQAAPGDGPGPGPLVVPAEQLHADIGLSTFKHERKAPGFAVVDTALA